MVNGPTIESNEFKELIAEAVKVAIKEFNQEQLQSRKKKALHNTKMLLKNYNKIKSSIEEAISEANQLEYDILTSDEEEVYINAIRKSKLKSLIVIAHIDKALQIVKQTHIEKETIERYEIFINCFMYGMSYEEAAEEFNYSKPSISRWINEVTKEISIQLFGIDGLGM